MGSGTSRAGLTARLLACVVVAMLVLAIALWIGAGSQKATAETGYAAARIGAPRVLSIHNHDAEDPFLAMNASGRFLVTWPHLQLWAPFFRVEGVVSGTLSVPTHASTYGVPRDFDPLVPVVSAVGERAVLFSERRSHGATRVWFGIGLTEAPPGSSRWRTFHLELPPKTVSGLGGLAIDDRGRLAADWVLGGGGSEFVLATQSHVGAPIRLTNLNRAAVAPLPPVFDQAGNLVVPYTTSGVSCSVAIALRRCVGTPDRSMVLTITPSGRRQLAQLASGCDETQIAAGAAGAMAIVLSCPTGRGPLRYSVVERTPAGQWTQPIWLSGSGELSGAVAAFDPAGDIWVAYDDQIPLTRHRTTLRVRTDVASAAPGAAFGKPAWTTLYIRYAGDAVSVASLIAGATGAMYLVSQDANLNLMIQRLIPGGALGAAAQLSPGAGTRNITVRTGPTGLGLAVWDRYTDHNQVEAAEFQLP